MKNANNFKVFFFSNQLWNFDGIWITAALSVRNISYITPPKILDIKPIVFWIVRSDVLKTCGCD